jgi:tyrosyl-tRNA synthetase
VTEPPEEMYGKTMSIPDELIPSWYELLLSAATADELGPRDAKRALARGLVSRFHGDAAAAAAEEHFDRLFVRHDAPEEMPTVEWSADPGGVIHLPALLASAFGISTSEARRTLAQGGVRVDGARVGNGTLDAPATDLDGKVLQLGKRRFARVNVR